MSDTGDPPKNVTSSRYKSKDFGYNSNGRYFAKYPRLRFLINLINISIQKDLYNIAYEVIKGFLSDLLKTKKLPIFQQLFQ